jgi:hypothetical protein
MVLRRSATKGCRPGSVSVPCANYSSGRRPRGRALWNLPACRSPRRSRSTLSAITPCSPTLTTTSTPAKRPSYSWVACRNIFGWTSRCDTPWTSRQRCTTHGCSSAEQPRIRRCSRHHSADRGRYHSPPFQPRRRARSHRRRAPLAGLPQLLRSRRPDSDSYPRPSSRSTDARASASTVMSPTCVGMCASASSTSSTTTTWTTWCRWRLRLPRCSRRRWSRSLTPIPRLLRPTRHHPRCPSTRSPGYAPRTPWSSTSPSRASS